MRKTIVVTVTAVFICAGSLGCKSAPKLAFWKSKDSADVESTALAHSAPTLPADLAKEAESLASTSPNIEMSAPSTSPVSQAPPYTPTPYSPASSDLTAAATPPAGSGTKTTPSTYPVTSAPSFTATAPKTPVANIPNVPTVQSANLGSLDMPYNPSAVPPARNVASTATPTTPNQTAGRYGSLPAIGTPPASISTPNTAPLATTPAQPAAGSGSRYGSIPAMPAAPFVAPSTNTEIAATAPSTTSTPASTTIPAIPAVNPVGDRYATTSPVTPAAQPSLPAVAPYSSAPYSSAPVTPEATTTPKVATIPFRPGGTSSYQAGNSPAVEVATRPASVEQSAPSTSTPGSMTEPSTAPRYR